MENVQNYLIQGAEILAILTIVATIVARFIPSQSFQENKKTATYWIWKVINFLPTIGVNPNTKELEKTYKELKQKHGEQ